MYSRLLKIFALVALVVGLTGCQHGMTKEMAMAEMQAAMARANEAYNLAQQANNLASDANFRAQEAQNTADAALQCCNDNAERMERMFEKTMAK